MPPMYVSVGYSSEVFNEDFAGAARPVHEA